MFRLLLCLAVLTGMAALAPAADDKKPDKPAKPTRPSAADRDATFQELIGKPAPEFLGEAAINGKVTSLKDLKGKVVVVDFWAVWCGPCIATFPHLREMQTKYKDKGLELVGVTSYYEKYGFDKGAGKLIRDQKLSAEQEQAMLKDFAAHHKLEHRLVVLGTKERTQVYKDYKVSGIPHVTVIDRKGNIQLIKVGSGEANSKAIEEMVKKLLDDKAA